MGIYASFAISFDFEDTAISSYNMLPPILLNLLPFAFSLIRPLLIPVVAALWDKDYLILSNVGGAERFFPLAFCR